MKKGLIIFLILIFIGGIVWYRRVVSESPLTQEEFLKEIIIENVGKLKNSSVLIDSTYQKSFNKVEINSLNTYLYSSYPAPKALYDVEKYRIRYTSLDENNKKIEIVSQLFVPKVSSEENLPIYVFGQGTTGLGDTCAPSRENPRVDNWGDYQTHMISYASQGYIVLFPDYEGFNDPDRIHHYFNAQLEARVLLDGTTATYEFFERENLLIKPQEAVFYAGYSQGGHAAFAVSDYAESYAPELPIKGVISYGGTTDIANLLKENPALAPYLAFAYSDFYGEDIVDPEQILLPALIGNLRNIVMGTCIGKIYQHYSGNARLVYNNDFYNSLFGNTLAQDFPELKKVFDENSTGLVKSNIPGLVLQGSVDPIVTVKSQKEFMRQSCNLGNNITYIEYPGVHHYQTRQISFRDTLNWMQNITNGNSPNSDCGNL